MGKATGIQWCDDTVNPTTGCDGCELWSLLNGAWGGPCYAGNLHETRLAKSLPKLYAPTFTDVRLVPGRMAKAVAAPDLAGTKRPDKPWLDGMPRLIFVGDLGDIFSAAVPFEFLADEVIGAATSKNGSRHILMLLTKQPQRMADFAEWLLFERGTPWPSNVWAGASVTKQANVSRVARLATLTGTTLFVSVEPQRESINLRPWLDMVQLVICGGESSQGKYAATPFDLAWARSLRDQCREKSTAFFLKQVGSRPYDSFYRSGVADQRIHLKDRHGGDWSEWSKDLRIREFPAVAEAVP